MKRIFQNTSVRHPIVLWLMACVLGTILTTAVFLRHDRTHVVEMDFAWSDEEASRHVSEWNGWSDELDAVLEQGRKGVVIFDFHKDVDESVLLEIEVSDVPDLEAAISVGRQSRRLEQVLVGGTSEIDLSGFLGEDAGIYRVMLEAEAPPVFSGKVQPFRLLRVTTSAPREIRRGAFGFLLVCSFSAWFLVGSVFIAEAHETVRKLRGSRTRACAVLMGGAFFLVVLAPEWYVPKRFDDVRAVSNAGVIMDTGADEDRLFFRSRQRPAFVSMVLPVAALFPLERTIIQTSPADFHRQVWREYDRAGRSWGLRLFPELSILAVLQFGLVCMLLLGLLIRTGLDSTAAAAGVLCGALCYWNIVYNGLTLTWNLLINLAAFVAYAQWVARPIWYRAVAFGLLLALAGLTKTTAITTAIPLAVHFVWLLRSSPVLRRTMIAHAALAALCGAAPVLIWYEVFLGGFFNELRQFNADQYALIPYHPEYPLRTPGNWLKELWRFGSITWIPVVGGIVAMLLLRGERPWLSVFGAWLAGALLLPLVMPFVFARFFVYAIPAVAFFSAWGIRWVIVKWRRQ